MEDYVRMYEAPRDRFERERMDRVAGWLRTETDYVEGIARWKSNTRVIPPECAALAAHLGLPINLEATASARDEEIHQFLEEYRRNYRPPTGEQLAEMRAAFGPGETVVDVFSGHKVRT